VVVKKKMGVNKIAKMGGTGRRKGSGGNWGKTDRDDKIVP